MKASGILRALFPAVFVLAALAAQQGADCPSCDCSHYPVTGDGCSKCCFSQKGTVTSSSGTTITVAPVSNVTKQPVKTFQIRDTTKMNGQPREGDSATIYYHAADGQDVATRIDLLRFLSGALVPANLPNPPDICEMQNPFRIAHGWPAIEVPADAMRVFLGNTEVYSTSQRFMVLKIDDDETMLLQKTETGMFVSLRVRDQEGRLIAQVVDNQFFINPHNSFQIKGAGTNSLKVYNGRGDRIFDLELLNPRVVIILGTFFGPQGEEITIGKDQQIFTDAKIGSKLSFLSPVCIAGSHGAILMDGKGMKLGY
jgi:hypothetical protein